jgi:cytochrome c553
MRYAILLCFCFLDCTTMQMARELPGAGGSASSGGRIATNLPCDVDSILVANCQSCHGSRPSGGAPMSLVTYADLAAKATTDPSQTVAAMCVTRINSTSAPMPPTPPMLSAADIATFTAWVDGGMPMGDCVSGVDPLNAAPTCTSGQTWNGGNDGSSRMNPGMACINCHSQGGEGPRYAIAGTVYPTGHEPDRCNGTSAAQVIITDSAGQVLTLTPNSAGNFYASRVSLSLPYNAKVVANGLTRAMSAAQTDGDCNGCHTQNGDNGAPGRITLP